jgi:hypothetical protein
MTESPDLSETTPASAPDELDDGVFVPLVNNDYAAYDEFVARMHEADQALREVLAANLEDHRDFANGIVLDLLQMRNRTIREEYDIMFAGYGIGTFTMHIEGEPNPISHYRLEPA